MEQAGFNKIGKLHGPLMRVLLSHVQQLRCDFSTGNSTSLSERRVVGRNDFNRKEKELSVLLAKRFGNDSFSSPSEIADKTL